MQSHRLLTALSALGLSALIAAHAAAQTGRPRFAVGSGLITDRMSSRQLKHWEGIKRLALALGDDYRPLHPTLYRLWEWAEQSGHAIYLELPDPDGRNSSTAGRFDLEWCDLQGKRHAAVIRLYLETIDRAYVGPDTMRANGHIPLEGLTREERYAEVLGHELAHAYHILTDLQLASSIEEAINQTNALLLYHNAKGKGRELEPEMKRRLERRDLLLATLEAYAEQVESVIWHELTASKKTRNRRRQVARSGSASPFFPLNSAGSDSINRWGSTIEFHPGGQAKSDEQLTRSSERSQHHEKISQSHQSDGWPDGRPDGWPDTRRVRRMQFDGLRDVSARPARPGGRVQTQPARTGADRPGPRRRRVADGQFRFIIGNRRAGGPAADQAGALSGTRRRPEGERPGPDDARRILQDRPRPLELAHHGAHADHV
ncbi:MAG TPA: hypothetical protein VJ302_24405 [Blastocatellia bacterium]|nr:hypothetical protein [Blastocatellia bacterium]